MVDIWELDISFYSDGDFGWDFAPIDMRCDHYRESYSLHIYREIPNEQSELWVRNQFSSILNFLINNIHGRDSATEYVKDVLMKALRDNWDHNFDHKLFGNYDRSHIIFKIHSPKDKRIFKIECTADELEKIQDRYLGDCHEMVNKLLED